MFQSSSHPVATALAVAHEELDDLADIALFGLNDGELAAQQATLAQLANKVAGLELRLMAESDSRGLDTKATLVTTTRQAPATAHRRLRLACALDTDDHTPIRAAMSTGEVSEAQAERIVDALTAIPTSVERSVRADAQAMLVDLAGEHHTATLRTLGRRILTWVAPQVADQVHADALQREHDHALATTRLSLTDDGHGRCYLRGHIPSHVGAMLRRNLLALAAPKHVRAAGADGERSGLIDRPGPERLGHAFCELIERYPTDQLPHAGGVQARAVVTLDVDQLLGSLEASGVATLDGTDVPAGVARRLACEAGLIPAVLDGKSQPLDLGRSKRFHTPTQRIAISLRDKTCTAEGCDWPPGLCHVHHDEPWSKSGKTTIADGRLLCPRHHHLAHHPTWQMTKTKHGRVTFIRR